MKKNILMILLALILALLPCTAFAEEPAYAPTIALQLLDDRASASISVVPELNATDVQSVKVQLFCGTQVLAENTLKTPTGIGAELTSPFWYTEADQKAETDWDCGTWSPANGQQPDGAKAIITLNDGTEITASCDTADVLHLSKPWNELFPVPTPDYAATIALQLLDNRASASISVVPELNATDVQSVKVQLFCGTQVLAENTLKTPTGIGAELTSPFWYTEADQKAEADWDCGTWSPANGQQPDGAKAIIILNDGTEITASCDTADVLHLSKPWNELFPVPTPEPKPDPVGPSTGSGIEVSGTPSVPETDNVLPAPPTTGDHTGAVGFVMIATALIMVAVVTLKKVRA